MTEPGASMPPPGTSHPAPPPPSPLPPPAAPSSAAQPGAGRSVGAVQGPQVEDDLWSTTRIHAATPGRDPTPPYVRRMRSRRERAAAAAARPTRRRGGPSAGLIAGVIVPILFLVVGAAFIAAALDADQDDDVVLRPPPALESSVAPVNETAPPPMAAPPPTTAAPAPETTIAPDSTVPPESTLAPDSTVPPESTLAPETTVPPTATSPEVGQAVEVANAYLAAIVSGDYAAALRLGPEGLTEVELADRFPGIVAGRAELIDAGPPGPNGIPLRLLLATEHDLEGERDAALTCVRWDVNAGVVTEAFSEERYRQPGALAEPQLVQARIDCAVLPLG